MNKTLTGIVASFALVLSAGIALAGGERIDAKTMSQPILEQNCNWTGFYIGANVGYAGGNFVWTDRVEGSESGGDENLVDKRQSGFIGVDRSVTITNSARG